MVARIEESRPQWELEALEQLRQLVPASTRQVCQVEERVGAGRAADEIIRLAAETSTDLVVAGVSGSGALDRALLGSVTHAVVHGATCPVLTVRLRPAA